MDFFLDELQQPSVHEQRLCRILRDHPKNYNFRYDSTARNALLEKLFWSLAAQNESFMKILFPRGIPTDGNWSLCDAQGCVDGAEYSAAAKGKPCGHIFKNGEATYRCKTCGMDETCVLCTRCFDSSDHSGHMVYVSISPGNSGCCDCGDFEAWRALVHCAIHSVPPNQSTKSVNDYDGDPQSSLLPEGLVEAIRMTLGRVTDYLCDVISCSPEQLRFPKTKATILEDEKCSRFTSAYYGTGDMAEENPEFCLVLWNDEKHTIVEVRDQVARACKKATKFGSEKANEANDVGRTIIEYSRDIDKLLAISRIIEQIKVTVTIRSSRDVFREQMCGSMIEWLLDIAGCSIGGDCDILRLTICEEMLRTWRAGSTGINCRIGRKGIDDHEREESDELSNSLLPPDILQGELEDEEEVDEEDDDDEYALDEDLDEDDDDDEDDVMDLDIEELLEADEDGDLEMQTPDEPDDENEASEATLAGYPPPPPPPAPLRRDFEFPLPDFDPNPPVVPSTMFTATSMEIPRTPRNQHNARTKRPMKYWIEKPAGFHGKFPTPLYEDLWRRVRLDWMILFDLRLWKKARIDLRDLYITTVVRVPQFKRILALRFAGLYTTLAQLYLIADREPDHSIINLSLQMLTSPSIAEEVVERGNFLTNLLAIHYTFLTSRQVGHPQDVDPRAVLSFEIGSLTNRRMYHFSMDMKYLFTSEAVQEMIRNEERYMMQFLDLVKLHQGICYNERATGNHVEYETDVWISASLVTRELNKMCRQFAESFKAIPGVEDVRVGRAIRLAAKVAIINSMGAERDRFTTTEMKDETRFKTIGGFEFDFDELNRPRNYRVVDFVVERQGISFHHALHYTLSWLIQGTKCISSTQLRAILDFTSRDLWDRETSPRLERVYDNPSEEYLLAMFDIPLRVCAWLAQMKAGMWVRNGMSLRHQMNTYRGVMQRDIAHHCDIFLLQVAIVTCDPSAILASIIDRFGMENWMKGCFAAPDGWDELQTLDVAEELIHLLTILITERLPLFTPKQEPNPQDLVTRRDITHILCFKPLSFSELTGRLPEKYNDSEEFLEILQEMTNYRGPEGTTDTGIFELKREYHRDLDPFIAHYNKNQREESEALYRTSMSLATQKPSSEIVFELTLRPIEDGLFKELSAFTRTNLFIQIVFYSLVYIVDYKIHSPKIPLSRLDAFLQMVSHLILLVISEDLTEEAVKANDRRDTSFVYLAITKNAKDSDAQGNHTIFALLCRLACLDDFKVSHPKLRLIFHRIKEKRPQLYSTTVSSYRDCDLEILDAKLPTTTSHEDLESKKRKALARRKSIMNQMQKQQQSFISKQADIDWGFTEVEESDSESEDAENPKGETWKYPSDNCILCQEETGTSRPYGTFAYFTESNFLRLTDLTDADFVREAANTPSSLDRSTNRPFGISGQNQEMVRKLRPDGSEIYIEKQGLGKGFPPSQVRRGPVSIGCGHITHFACFELYYASTLHRHRHQIARSHPERPSLNEFICPLCKALGNAFLPIIWKSKEESYPSKAQPSFSFEKWILTHVGPSVGRLRQAPFTEQEYEYNDKTLFLNLGLSNPNPAFIPKVDQLPSTPWMSHGSSGRSSPQLSANGSSTVFTHDTPTSGSSPISVNTDLSPNSVSQLSPRQELFAIYRRLRDTIELNHIHSRYTPPLRPPIKTIGIEDDLTFTDSLAKSFGFSISAIEVAQRGVEAKQGSTLLERIPELSLVHLKVLSETVLSYISMGALRVIGMNKTATEFRDTQGRQLHQIFIGHPQIFDMTMYTFEMKQLDPILAQDSFIFFAECSSCIVPALGLDAHHIFYLCYLAEIVKTLLAFTLNESTRTLLNPFHTYSQANLDSGALESEPRHKCFGSFVNRIAVMALNPHPTFRAHPSREDLQVTYQYSTELLENLRKIVARYALPFLRKSLILFHARYGVKFPNTGLSDFDEPELDRLSKALRLPSLDEIFASLSESTPLATISNSIIHGWIWHWGLSQEGTTESGRFAITLAHPSIPELVGLPNHFDTLVQEAMKRKCPTSGKDLNDPALCLFCGEIFCSQAYCCTRTDPRSGGGCHQHLKKCGGDIGLFIHIRKCSIFYLHAINGTWAMAPYLDAHGEVDPGMRRNRQLFLSPRRYDTLLRNIWLSHSIPTTIARKLESEINNGGWETV